MARKQGVYDEFLDFASTLKWRSTVYLALITFVVFHFIAIQTLPLGPGASPDVQRQLIHFGAVFLRFAIPFGFLVGGSVAYIKARRASKLFTKINANAFSTVSALSSTEFERLVGEGFRRQGYHVVEGPGRAPDGGVDLHITKDGAKYFVQCKHWRSRQVGVKVVRELYGVIAARGAAGGFVVTGGHFSRDAAEFASGREIELIDGNRLEEFLSPSHSGALSELSPGQPNVLAGNIRQAISTEIPPTCPKCGTTMRYCTAAQGGFSGQPFWGCSQFPKCRAVVKMR
jgi:restriction system protein